MRSTPANGRSLCCRTRTRSPSAGPWRRTCAYRMPLESSRARRRQACPLPDRHPLGQGEQLRMMRHDVLGKPARSIQAEVGTPSAADRHFALAPFAVTAASKRIDGNRLADAPAAHLTPDLGDGPGKLVAGDL